MTFISNYPPVTESDIKGKPYITVSAKGIVNGLSDIPNDGADFGPDTMLNATDPSQIGAPYTQTSGIQEAINYVLNFSLPNRLPFPEIFLLQGWFIINDNATIWINNNPNSSSPYNPTGLHIRGVSEDQYACAIVKQNSLPSPIISFTNPYGYTPTGFTPTGMTFENFSVWYQGSASNVTSGVTMANLSIPEIGESMTVFRNLQMLTSNPINNTLLDISGHEDATIDNVLASNAGGPYNPSITVPALKAYMPNGNVNMYRVMASGIDIETQQANIINSTIGAGAGPGIIFRPSLNGATLNLQGTYFNGPLTRLITISPMTTGTTYSGQINLKSTLISKTPTGNGDYMIEPNTNIPVTWDFEDAVLINNNSSYSLYLFDPNVSTNDEYLNLYTHAKNNNGVILKTENSASGTTAGTVSMKFITYLSTYKKLMIYLSGYENNTTTNQTMNYPLPFSTSAIITGNNTGLTISASTTGITITSPNSTTTYSGVVIIEGY
jgi:hypothetical protein